jgi:hypothetical protein
MLKLSQILPPPTPKKIKPLPSTRGKDTPKTRQKTRETQTRQRSRGTQPPTRQTVPGTAVRLLSFLVFCIFISNNTWLYKWFNFITWLLGVPFSKLYLILPHLASVIVAITVNIFCFANGQNFLHFLSQTGS